MEITKNNLLELFNDLTVFSDEVHLVNIDCIIDAGINPREVDIKYAEQIPLSAPPIILGIIKNDEELGNKLIIIDGNHRMYSYLNVHLVQKCYAVIKVYENRGQAIVDAYKYNINHGKRLTDREIINGIKKTVNFLKMNNDKATFDVIADMLNMSRTSMSEYVMWDRVEKVVGEEIDKIKATKLHTILKDKDNGVNNLKKFYKLNKNLSTRKIKEAIKFYKETGRIVDYEQYLIKESLSKEDDINDALQEEPRIKPKSISISNNRMDFNDDDETEEEEEPETNEEIQTDVITVEKNITILHTPSIEEEKLESNEVKNNLLSTNKSQVSTDTGYQYNTTENVEEGKLIETDAKLNVKKDELINYKGLTRKYSFDTVLGNIFKDLQEDVLNSKSLFEETLNKYLHENRDKFENRKDEYLVIIKNCQDILSKMARTIERANKDLKQ